MSTTALHEAAPAVPSTATEDADLAARRRHGMASRRSARRDVSTGDEYGAGQRTRTNLSRSRHRMEGLLRDVLLEVLFHFAGHDRRRARHSCSLSARHGRAPADDFGQTGSLYTLDFYPVEMAVDEKVGERVLRSGQGPVLGGRGRRLHGEDPRRDAGSQLGGMPPPEPSPTCSGVGGVVA